MKKLGELIKESRLEKGIKAKQLAEKCGVKPSYITHIENDGYIPNAPVILAIYKMLGEIELLEAYLSEKHPDIIEVLKVLLKRQGDKKFNHFLSSFNKP